uniref:PRO2379 n=1 Tax=Homo sapiens TaxID=9606 RepID=Q9P1D7_HUMAN|nr:PRO2379 [Homo sapiens]
MVIFTILILLIHEHRRFSICLYHLWFLSSVFCSSMCRDLSPLWLSIFLGFFLKLLWFQVLHLTLFLFSKKGVACCQRSFNFT